MNKTDIEKLRLSPPQLCFDFEENPLKEQAVVYACLQKVLEQYGYAELGASLQRIREECGLSEAVILQHIFWLAVDLKIHFRLDGVHRKPYECRRALLRSPRQPVTIISNDPVSPAVYQDVKDLYKRLFGEEGAADPSDQYALARCLVKKIGGWKRRLETCRDLLRKMPFIPYQTAIDDDLRFLEDISRKPDSFPLITTFHDHEERILKLAGEIEEITAAYLDHIAFWKKMIQSLEVIDHRLPKPNHNTDVSEHIDALRRILSSRAPAGRIPEAENTLSSITQQYRTILLSRLDGMIERMQAHLEAHQATSDVRNRALYFLREAKKRVGGEGSLIYLAACFGDAQEKFDTSQHEIEMGISVRVKS